MALSLSSTALSEAARCLRAYQYHFVDRLVPKPSFISRPVRRGIWLHRGLQEMHTGGNWQNALVALYRWAESHGVGTDECQAVYDETRLLLDGYERFYGKSQWEPIAAEKQYSAGFGDTELRATIDWVGKTEYGTTLVEFKSTGDVPPGSWRAVDPQTALQCVLLAKNGVMVDTILFDYIKTTPTVPRVTKEGFFYETTAVTTSAHFQEAANKVTATWREREEDGTPIGLNDYLTKKRAQLVDDGKFYQRFHAPRELPLLRETMKDISGIVSGIKQAQTQGHYPRSFDVFRCKFCSYNSLCVTEYVKGDISRVLRQEEFDLDRGVREGQAV